MSELNNIQSAPVVFDFVGTVAIAAITSSRAFPMVGLTKIYGLVYSTTFMNFVVEEGVDDKASALDYRFITTIPIVAGVAQKISIPIGGKFCRVRLDNSAGLVIASVECFIAARSFE
mgnify:CR=1 FL=1